MISTTLAKGQKQNMRRGVRLWAVAVWLIVWQLGAMALGQEILLVSPVSVLLRLLELIPHWDFWGAILFSFWRITLGFLLACLAGTALGVLSSRFGPVRDLAAPLMGVIKSIPVASFVILVLIWVPSRNLSVVISFLMVTPIVYSKCWKAGVAAEVIGLPDGSIGERLYEAKVYLNTPDLFAWTVVIVLVSLVFEKLFLFLLDRLVARLERG